MLTNSSPLVLNRLGLLPAGDLHALTASTADSLIGWSGPIAFEGVETGDGRILEVNSLNFETLPVALRAVSSDSGGHDGAVYVGTIDAVERQADGVIFATGVLDPHIEEGRAFVERAQRNGNLPLGVSVDLDDMDFVVTAKVSDEDAETETDEEVLYDSTEYSELVTMKSARLRGATLVDIPAFLGAEITLDLPEQSDEPEGESGTVSESADDSLVAAAAPLLPPAVWFTDPVLTEPTPFRVTEDGRVFGHIAAWDTCHTAYDVCTKPPYSVADYAYFKTGSTMLDDGREISTGRITLDTLHANGRATASATLAHYEQTGKAVADVVAGEDEFGIWVSGALRSTVSDETKRVLRASPLSGDWRRIGGNLELVAVLAVNTPGFPIPRPQGLVASGVVQSLVASGMLAPREVIAPSSPDALSVEDLRYLKSLAKRGREAQAERLERISKVSSTLRIENLSKRWEKVS